MWLLGRCGCFLNREITQIYNLLQKLQIFGKSEGVKCFISWKITTTSNCSTEATCGKHERTVAAAWVWNWLTKMLHPSSHPSFGTTNKYLSNWDGFFSHSHSLHLGMDHERKGCGCKKGASETPNFAESQNSKHQCFMIRRCVYLETVYNAKANGLLVCRASASMRKYLANNCEI